jgi:hypothetical protein
MNKKRLAELYGNFELFIEAFTAVEKDSFIQDDTNEKMNVYKVTFNENEFMSFKELCELSDILKKVAEHNGIDTSRGVLKLGRGNKPIDFTDTSLNEVA